MVSKENIEKKQSKQQPPPEKKTMQINVTEIAKLVKEKLASALGKEIYSISSVSPSGDGWAVEIEVVEEEHIVSNFDVIGIYEARLDLDGNLVSWSRKGLRQRG